VERWSRREKGSERMERKFGRECAAVPARLRWMQARLALKQEEEEEVRVDRVPCALASGIVSACSEVKGVRRTASTAVAISDG
jgi:hypothetical protein